ncbi:MAG: hypothetical protein IKC37_04180 [Clostridia bacterium]|nr:hypothetical protein [Clostridia bacterium]
MKYENVAVLDVRSHEVTFMIGSKGLNDTFIFNATKSEDNGWISRQGFADEGAYVDAINVAVSSVKKNYIGQVKKITVSVPSSFIKVYTKGHTISFDGKRKISMQDVDRLFACGLNDLYVEGRCVKSSAMYFILGDNRKYFDVSEILGATSPSLRGALSFYFVDENFYRLTTSALRAQGYDEIEFIPSTQAQVTYLLPKKLREGYAVFVDMGVVTTSVSVVYGGGIVREETYDIGYGYVVVQLMQDLSVTEEQAERMLQESGVSGKAVPIDVMYTDTEGNVYSAYAINESIKCALDKLCEVISKFLEENYRERAITQFSNNPVFMTGEGMTKIIGAVDHVSQRTNRLAKVVYPDLPYYDKPAYSSRISLLNAATEKEKNQGVFDKIFRLFGGRK